MQLVLTRYLDRSPEEIRGRLDQAVTTAMAAAADRVDSSAVSPRVKATAGGAVVSGLDILDDTEINWAGDASLTTVRVLVPWRSADTDSGKKLLAANRFAQVFAEEASAAG